MSLASRLSIFFTPARPTFALRKWTRIGRERFFDLYISNTFCASPSLGNHRRRFRIRKLATAARVHFPQPVSLFIYFLLLLLLLLWNARASPRYSRPKYRISISPFSPRAHTHSTVLLGPPSQITRFPINLFWSFSRQPPPKHVNITCKSFCLKNKIDLYNNFCLYLALNKRSLSFSWPVMGQLESARLVRFLKYFKFFNYVG